MFQMLSWKSSWFLSFVDDLFLWWEQSHRRNEARRAWMFCCRIIIISWFIIYDNLFSCMYVCIWILWICSMYKIYAIIKMCSLSLREWSKKGKSNAITPTNERNFAFWYCRAITLWKLSDFRRISVLSHIMFCCCCWT